MNITEFLLDRIGETEAAVSEYLAEWNRRHAGASIAMRPAIEVPYWTTLAVSTWDEDGPRWVALAVSPEYVLSECKAKRLMIEDAQQIASDGDGEVGYDVGSLLIHMSRPYSDHPDYHWTWRATDDQHP